MMAACDLQPKIMSLPDSVGDFISTRYPALLADPETQPEIYNSAATDYGVYASPDLYGGGANDDYVLYASANDYILPPFVDSASAMYGDAPVDTDMGATGTNTDVGQEIVYYSPDGAPATTDSVTDNTPTPADADEYLRVPMYGGSENAVMATVTVARGDTLYSIARKYGISVDELARLNNLSAPYSLSPGQKLKVGSVPGRTMPQTVTTKAATATVKQVYGGAVANSTTRVAVSEIKVGAGDTLYSISRKYSVPVNDLAVMNKLTPPFMLTVGQTLRVPNLSAAQVRSSTATTPMAKSTAAVTVVSPATKTSGANVKTTEKSKSDKASTTSSKPKEKISSDPTKKLPKIGARSSSKFSWPVRGTILSHFGAKSGGLFNDGINIGATRGAKVGAAENGVVAYAGNEVKGMGNLIIIQHSGGWMTVYAHMDSMLVRRGARVSVGQKIGTVGATGKVDKPQLHFEIRKGTKAYNPTSYLKK